MRTLALFILLSLYLPFYALAGHGHALGMGHTDVKFAENKGQWEPQIQFKADIPAGNLFIENTSLVYVFMNEDDMNVLFGHAHGNPRQPVPENFVLRGHCFKIHFKSANSRPAIHGEQETPDYVNYYIGNDPEKWASGVKQYNRIHYENIYPGIEYRIYGKEGNLKYDLLVDPEADPNQIKMEYEGLENIELRYGELHIKTSVNEMIEQKPYAYQLVNGVQKEVTCLFNLSGNTVGFEFPEGYDHSLPLVIDPALIFSSYTGSGKDNWGYTATYDNAGNLYGAGIVMNLTNGVSTGSYPTVGAFQSTHNGGTSQPGVEQIDMGISKFSSDGSTLIFSTYLGGAGNDVPHSLVVDASNELVILGTSSSANYPTSATAFDRSFNGGTAFTANNGLIDFSTGTDIVVTKLNAAGSGLIGSTYIGGSGNDGINISNNVLKRNYGDDFRGEVYTDNTNNIYVASTTSSSLDFPTVNAIQPSYGGGRQDACVFKLNVNLSALVWSSYLGGTADDAGYSLQIDHGGNALVAGGTNSGNFPTTAGALHPTIRGGVDGFLSKIDPSGSTLLASTFIGTTSYDQNFFVQFDAGDSVYVVGQTQGNYPVTPAGIYSEPNGGQYIHKLTPGLDSTVFSMRFGTNRPNQVDISLSAFLVNDCDHIYVSGWGGAVNVSTLPGSTTNGLTVTQGAHKTTTDGSDFYLIAFAENADSVIYATFFGGTGAEHVDGGTSRFDKKGIVYQAVCAGCGGNNSFPTTTGAWSTQNGSSNCNLGVIKFDMSKPFSSIRLSSPPYICVPGNIQFGNDSRGTDFFWDFDDGTTSTDFEPVHLFKDTGTYEVMLVVSDSALCVTTDTSYVIIRGVPPPQAEISTISPLCEGDSIQIISTGGTSRKWYPAHGLSNDTVANPMASPDTSTTYRLVVTDSCSSDTAYIRVEVFPDETYVMDDTAICLGQQIILQASGGVNYVWHPAGSLDKNTLANPTAKPITTTTYKVSITDANDCTWSDTIRVEVDTDLPVANITNDTVICYGDAIILNASGGTAFRWEPPLSLNNNLISNPTAAPLHTITYTAFISNACGVVSDKVKVEVSQLFILSVGDSIACVGQPARLTVVGADFYEWQPEELLSRNDVPNPRAIITEPTLFSVRGYNNLGCETDTSFLLGIREAPFLEAGIDRLIAWGQTVVMEPAGTGEFHWTPPLGLSCEFCENPKAKPEVTTKYYLTLTDEFGCKSIDSLIIYVSGTVFVPNAFTPNGDGRNDEFGAITNGIKFYQLSIFNRWGEMVFYSEDVNSQWDGTYRGKEAPNDSYVWRMKYTEISGKKGEKEGLVNLIR